ncbi:MAG TPA: hypothetical protein VGK33_19360, partial [Chloroflexota bacterium]
TPPRRGCEALAAAGAGVETDETAVVGAGCAAVAAAAGAAAVVGAGALVVGAGWGAAVGAETDGAVVQAASSAAPAETPRSRRADRRVVRESPFSNIGAYHI